MCSGSEEGSYLRLTDSCTTQLKAQGLFRTCNESKEQEEAGPVLLQLVALSEVGLQNSSQFKNNYLAEM